MLALLWLLLGGGVNEAMRRGGAFVGPQDFARFGAQASQVAEVPSVARLTEVGIHPELAALVRERMSLRYHSAAWGLGLLALSALVIEGRRRGLLRGTAAVGFLLLIVVADLWMIDRKFYHPVPRRQTEAILMPDEAVRFLQAQPQPFRILPVESHTFASNRYAAFGIESVGGYQPAKLRSYDDLIRSGALSTLPVLSMLNVRYLLSGPDLSASGLPLVTKARNLRGDSIHIYENPGILPRAWFVAQWRRQPAPPALLEAMGSDGFRPDQVAYVYPEDAEGLPDSLSRGQVLDLKKDPHHLRLSVRVTGTRPGLLVLSEIYYRPGWQATLDGEVIPLRRVNHVLRALEVPPGEHAIELRAVSPARQAGLWASRFCGLIVLVLLAAGGLRARWRRPRGGSGSE
jgi:hypothetical protein